MSWWRREKWTADDRTVARELLTHGWHDAVSLSGGALEPRKAGKIADRFVELGYAKTTRRGFRHIWKATDTRALTKIANSA